MEAAKLLVRSQLRRTNYYCGRFSPMIHNSLASLRVSGIHNVARTEHLHKTRKRGRYCPQTIVSAWDFRREFSTSRVAMENDTSHATKRFEKQLDQLLEEYKSPKYRNVWKLPPRGVATEISSSNIPTNYCLHPLDSDGVLDRQSRFLLELLQTLQQIGLTNTSDRVTTKRCNTILKRLATFPNNRKKKAKRNDTTMATAIDHWQRLERARTIVETMESYLSLQQNLGSQIPMELPIPSHDTYFWLLKLYSSAQQVSEADLQRAQSQTQDNRYDVSLLQTANEAPLEARALVQQLQDSGDLALRPTSLHWNQVLSCYANAVRRPNRPLEAATLLYDLLQNDKSNGGTVDASSFAHVLRACADPSALEDFEDYRGGRIPGTNSWKEKEAFAKLALGVAKRVWKGLEQEQDPKRKRSNSNDELLDVDSSPSQNGILMNSHHFVHMLKAGRNFATHLCTSHDDDDDEEEDWLQAHEQWMRSMFEKCCKHQKVNIHVLQEILYQGAVVRCNVGDDDDDDDDYRKWIERIVLPQQSTISTDLARFCSRWDTEILPSLIESQTKNKLSYSSRRNLQSVYASTIHQTRILMRYLPSRWRAKAD